MTLPMLADFALRLACGLGVLLLITPWREVPLAFYRTHCLVILGLLVLAGLDVSRFALEPRLLGAILSASVLAYLAAVAWGLGLPRVGRPLLAFLVVIGIGVLVAVSRASDPVFWLLNGSGRLASAFLMGSTLTAMLLGHHYLTAPAMTMVPLKRFVLCIGWGLGIRALIGSVGLGVWLNSSTTSAGIADVSPLFLAVRWGMGMAGPALATWMTWKTVEIHSTQSATGILYIAMTLVLFGELTAMALSRGAGIVF